MDEFYFPWILQLLNLTKYFVVEYRAEVERTRLADEQLEAAEEFSKTGAPEAQGMAEVRTVQLVIYGHCVQRPTNFSAQEWWPALLMCKFVESCNKLERF